MALNFNTSGEIDASTTLRLTIASDGILKNTQPSFQGYFNNYTSLTSNFNPYLNTVTSRNVSVNAAASSITVPTAGYYHVYCQQLVNTEGVNGYLCIRINGGIWYHSYSDNDTTYDMNIQATLSLAANDVVSFYYQNSITYAWGGGSGHSSVLLHMIG